MKVHSLSASRLQCGYGNRSVGPVCDLNLDAGKIHAFIGANGAGKSTLVRTLAGLQPAIDGCAKIGSQDVHRMKPAMRAELLAFVSSVPPAASGLTAGEVLGLMPGSREEHQAALRDWGDLGWWESYMTDLSDGQRQRVMLARAFLQGSPWVILDEPTAFLDAKSRTTLYRQLHAMAKVGKGIVITTHDLHLLHGQSSLGEVVVVGESLHWMDPTARVTDWEQAY